MRAAGVNEKFITGDSSDREKFSHWASTVPLTARNPLYHWTHLELQRYFDIDTLLDPSTASEVYEESNEKLASLPVQEMILRMNVKLICTVEGPLDDLSFHKNLQASDFPVNVLTTFRPDPLLDTGNGFHSYVKELGNTSNMDIQTFDDFLNAIGHRVEYFHSSGCRLADHGLERMYAEEYTVSEIDSAFTKLLTGEKLSNDQADKFKSAVLYEMSKMYHEKGWAQLFHLGALRNTNSRLSDRAGADCGADSIGDFPQAVHMARFFDKLDREDKLAPTTIFNLNPADNEVFASMVGNFNDGSKAGKMQFGSGWWFLDQKDGMEKQMNALSNLGLLSQFVGMVTDSRSFLSYPRHEYFRRILCNLIGTDVVNGELPYDLPWLGSMVQDICYNNARDYFNFD
jgi:glucuronate isomerase